MGEVTDAQERVDGLIALACDFYQRGWMWGTSGNLSVKLPSMADHDCPAELFAITGSGASKGALTYEGIVVLPESGRAGLPWLRTTWASPSAETAIHQSVYAGVPSAGAVLHVHTVASTALSLQAAANVPSEVAHVDVTDLEMLKGWGIGWTKAGLRASIPVLANRESMQDLAAAFSALLTERPVVPLVLVAGHGMTVWGASLAEAKNRLEVAEFICKVLWEQRR